MQRRVGLQAAGGQAAAADEEAVPYRGQSLPPAALPTGGLHLHPQTQVQRGLQEARALETLVPVERKGLSSSSTATTDAQDSRARRDIYVFRVYSSFCSYWAFCSVGNQWTLKCLRRAGYHQKKHTKL